MKKKKEERRKKKEEAVIPLLPLFPFCFFPAHVAKHDDGDRHLCSQSHDLRRKETTQNKEVLNHVPPIYERPYRFEEAGSMCRCHESFLSLFIIIVFIIIIIIIIVFFLLFVIIRGSNLCNHPTSHLLIITTRPVSLSLLSMVDLPHWVEAITGTTEVNRSRRRKRRIK